ncbi:MAG: 3-oxoacyl-ACP synthase [Candidatus Lokiarchaeota archaeon]|nr:3-oxoacyl-ACP synthase [Candidatus Lokiarchaeota archaeon]
MRQVGIESWGVYLPEHQHTSEYIARETGIPEDVLEDKFGIRSKTVPGPDDHTVKMGAYASIKALEKANLTPEDIDVIIWAGEVYAEHPMMTYGIKLQKYLGNPKKPWAFDINQRCGTFLVGMLIAKSFMETNPSIKRILIASGYRNSDLINYKNSRARFMTSLAASGVAAILKADYQHNEILGISVMTDGAFADDVYVPAGGTVMPISKKAIDENMIYLDVPDPEGLKERLDQKSMRAFINVIDDALHKSNLTRDNINYLALLHMKRSAYEYVAKEIGVDPYKQTIYLENIGHNGQNDGILSIDYGVKKGMIRSGNIVVIAAAGIGWAWNAGIIRWG